MHWTDVWHGERPEHKLARAALTPLSLLYAAGWTAYLGMYRAGLKRPAQPHAPILCVGNLRVGGSGKTPMVLHLCDVLERIGRPVVLSLSGYGAPRSEAATVAPEGPLDAETWGDEAALVRSERPETPLIVGRRRVLAATLAHKRYPGHVLLMDDGFQHLPLRKHVTLLLDPDKPFNSLCLPAGPYREPRSCRSRASLVLDPFGGVSAEGFRVVRKPPSFAPALDGPLQGLEVDALCAIGDPARFFVDLEGSGLVLRTKTALPDHDPISPRYLEASVASGRPLVVTAKDWVKIQAAATAMGAHVHVARQETVVEPAHEFERWIAQRLEEVSAQGA